MSSQNLSTFNKNDIGDCSHLKVGIVCSKWNSDITDNLYDGAYSTLIKLGINKENIPSLKNHGIRKVAIVSGLLNSEDPEEEAIIISKELCYEN